MFGLRLKRSGVGRAGIYDQLWSIGIYAGMSPLTLAPFPGVDNPVLCATDVLDVPAGGVADPFMVREGNTWHMFFEVMNTATHRGCIALATSADLRNWQYRRVVVEEPFHLSYPYVFRWRDDYYMLPESCEAHTIRLYRATRFPHEWRFVKTVMRGRGYLDPSVIAFGGKWWLFTCLSRSHTTNLCYADRPTGPWIEHPASPLVVDDARAARPGGRIVEHRGRLYRYVQSGVPKYGSQVRSFEVAEMTTASYREALAPPDPVLGATGSGWNSHGMHHIDAHELGPDSWIACVDGWTPNPVCCERN